MFKKLVDEIDEALFLGFDVEKKLLHVFRAIKEIQEMSNTEAAAITALQAQATSNDTTVATLKTVVDSLVLAAGDNPSKVAALDAVTVQLNKQQADTQAVIDAANAALVVPPPAA